MIRPVCSRAGAVVLLLGVSAPSDELAYAPAKGLTLRKSFTYSHSTDSETYDQDGEARSREDTHSTELVVVDEVLERDEERVLKLRRTYEEILAEFDSTSDMGGESFDHSTSMSSVLEGETVEFEWNSEDEEYEAWGEGVDRDVLDIVAFDIDFTELLPEEDVELDDSWELEPNDFSLILHRWQRLSLRSDDFDGEDIESPTDQDYQHDSTTTGEVTLTLVEFIEADGVRLALLEIEGSIERDSTIESSREREHGSFSHESTSESASEIEGVLKWHLAGGHLHELDLTIERVTSRSSTMTSMFRDRERVSEYETESEGTTDLEVRFEVE